MKLKKIRILDKDNGILSFDLKDILSVIEPFCKDYNWQIYFIDIERIIKNQESVSKLLIEINKDSDEKTMVNWDDITILSESIYQTIDMDMEGSNNEGKITVKAIDTSYWEVETSNNLLYKQLINSFRDIEV